MNLESMFKHHFKGLDLDDKLSLAIMRFAYAYYEAQIQPMIFELCDKIDADPSIKTPNDLDWIYEDSPRQIIEGVVNVQEIINDMREDEAYYEELKRQ